ncbi:MAG: sugar phosphate nucleotidyltransferase [Patescibacteria group bacterium]|nr:sugar phosphate nucleotidyltransferase [Patescibacteria group bacterium]
MNNNYFIVIMAGGSGTRLWPMSRCDQPKQFQNLCGEKSLIQETYDRVKDIVPRENIFVSLVKNILETSEKQLPEVKKENFIVETEGRNTGPAIAYAAANIARRNPQAAVITLPSDHAIEKLDEFQKSLKTVLNFVEKNPEYLATVGLRPTSPDTGLGYIKIGKKLIDSQLHLVERFVEKPNLEKAKEYVKSGKFLWNASYFCWRADKLLDMYKTYAPEVYAGIEKIIPLLDKKGSATRIEKIYKEIPKVPIDTAIAEKAEKIAVLPADLGWSDIGNWTTLYEFLTARTGNHTISRGNHIGFDDKNCLVYAQDKLLTTVGLKDIIVVDTPDVTFVCNKNRAQDVKKLIEKIQEKGKHEYL